MAYADVTCELIGCYALPLAYIGFLTIFCLRGRRAYFNRLGAK